MERSGGGRGEEGGRERRESRERREGGRGRRGGGLEGKVGFCGTQAYDFQHVNVPRFSLGLGMRLANVPPSEHSSASIK